MQYRLFYYGSFLLLVLLAACQEAAPTGAVFTKVSKQKTGIDFRNLLQENENFNIFKYQYFNNGGGVAIGDFNNDDLQDVVFTGNMVKNRLYINQGDLEFEDVTLTSGIAAKEGWCTGVTTVDINEDGWLDLYICRAGYPFDDLRSNLLFINNGDLTFSEQAATYGLNDLAYSTHSAFFDYDKDGDLDLFLLNHSTVEYSRGSLEILQVRNKKNPDFTNKLFRNDGGKFTNITEQAGITSNVLTFSLGINISDINADGWPDIFIGNDFNEPDYLFINQQDGTFSDQFAGTFDHTSMFTMGSDIADINRDGLLDMISLDMLPESNYLQKMHAGADNYNKVQLLEENGFFKQYSRNMLQLNNGDGTFSEIGQLAGVSNTDWSWAALFFDFDNDANKDLFIANGYPRDHTDMDFLNFTANEVVRINEGKDHVDFDGYMEQMPPILVPNYFYQNTGNLKFNNQAKNWGIDEALISQSAAYADFDKDGDLDLVLNNTAEYARVYRNNSEQNKAHHYLSVQLKGAKANRDGIGAKVRVYAQGECFYQEQFPVRGFQATQTSILHFGLGNNTKIDSLQIIWPTDEQQMLYDIAVNKQLVLEIKNAKKPSPIANETATTHFQKSTLFTLQHQENNFNDFNIQALLPWFYSRTSAVLAVADVNKDGREDLYFGNAKDAAAQLLLQQSDGTFKPTNQDLWEADALSEDTGALFFDANGDGHLDLYVASGSYEFPKDAAALQDRLYLNNGKGDFKKATLPNNHSNTSCITSTDIDQDGDLDLFVGGGYIHGRYPESYNSYLLINEGNATFTEQLFQTTNTNKVSAALWVDLNTDNIPELVLASEWMPVQVFEYSKGQFSERTNQYFDAPLSGLWNTLHTADFDGDGDQDLMAGNMGNNSQLSASTAAPLRLFHQDLDANGSLDPLLFYDVQGTSWPFVSREDLIKQLPHLRKEFLFFKAYANAQVEDILTPAQLSKATPLEASSLFTTYFENKEGVFIAKTLPTAAQIAPVYAIQSMDVNKDGLLDVILAGNHLHTRVKLGRLDGNHGQVLLGNGKGDFKMLPYSNSGLKVQGATRQLKTIDIAGDTHILFGVNNEAVQSFQIR